MPLQHIILTYDPTQASYSVRVQATLETNTQELIDLFERCVDALVNSHDLDVLNAEDTLTITAEKE